MLSCRRNLHLFGLFDAKFRPVESLLFLPSLAGKDESYRKAMRLSILGGVVQVASQLKASSVHVTFPTKEEWNEGSLDSRFMRRSGVQYHWENNGYATFDDFLAALQQKKRKTIKQVCHCYQSIAIEIQVYMCMCERRRKCCSALCI